MSDQTKNPAEQTVGDLVKTAREFNAGTMTLSGTDSAGEVTFLVLVAVDGAARRLLPKIEVLTDEEAEGGR